LAVASHEMAKSANGEQQAGQTFPIDMPDNRLTLHLVEAAAVTTIWHLRMVFWIATNSNVAGDASAATDQVNEMLQNIGDVATLRSQLPSGMRELQQILVGLVENDVSAHVRLHSFSAYMTLLHVAVGVSETIDVETGQEHYSQAPCETISVPEDHMRGLWYYLNELYDRLSGGEVSSLRFDAEGQRVAPLGVFPAPSLGNVTSTRFALQRIMDAAIQAHQSADTTDHVDGFDAGVDRQHELMFAVLASRMVLESQVEGVYLGPLAMLVLSQCERSRPKPLRVVGLQLFRRLRELARLTAEFAKQYFGMQLCVITNVFEVSGVEAAHSLSLEFMKQWGPRMLPWLEEPFFLELSEKLSESVTADKRYLPLLDVFSYWLRSDEFMREDRRKAIVEVVLQGCVAAGLSAQEATVQKFVHRVRKRPPPEEAPVPVAAAGAQNSPMPPSEIPTTGAQNSPMPPSEIPTRRITGKRSFAALLTPLAPPSSPGSPSLCDRLQPSKLARAR